MNCLNALSVSLAILLGSFLVVWIISEFIIDLFGLFAWLRRRLGKGAAGEKENSTLPETMTAERENTAQEVNGTARLKGKMERFILLAFLAAGIPQILIAFGALKLGTRFGDKHNQVSSDFFLMGTLLSMLIALGQFETGKMLALIFIDCLS